jgi:hypothetical protein
VRVIELEPPRNGPHARQDFPLPGSLRPENEEGGAELRMSED